LEWVALHADYYSALSGQQHMIGDLLKQLIIALGRYIRYHVSRVFGLNDPAIPVTTEPAKSADRDVQQPTRVDLLDDRIGLDAAYLEPLAWPTYRNDQPAAELETDPLYKLWRTTRRGHKWSQYFSIYREVFGPLTSSSQRILEIGVDRGASLELWKRYFSHPDTSIVGIDIDPACSKFDAPNEKRHVRIGSQNDANFLNSVVAEFGPFDLIIDDGSHVSSDVIVSFNYLFASGLKDSGIYFVEDLHSGYWTGWRDSRKSFLDVCAELVEHMHAHYRVPEPGNKFFSTKPSDNAMIAIEVPKITTMVREIRFFDSIVAIYKARQEYVPYYLRMD
jgi:hypothetical protein